MNFEVADSQINSLYGALPRDNLRMQECRKSDIHISFDFEKKGPFTKIIPNKSSFMKILTLCMLVLLIALVSKQFRP